MLRLLYLLGVLVCSGQGERSFARAHGRRRGDFVVKLCADAQGGLGGLERTSIGSGGTSRALLPWKKGGQYDGGGPLFKGAAGPMNSPLRARFSRSCWGGGGGVVTFSPSSFTELFKT